MPIEHHMRHKLTILTQYDIRANRAVRTYRAAIRNLRSCRHNRCRVDTHWGTASLGGAAFFGARGPPGTSQSRRKPAAIDSNVALHPHRAAAPVQHRHFDAQLISGVTGRRKRALSMPVNTISFESRSGISVISRAPPVCAIASTISTPGMIG